MSEGELVGFEVMYRKMFFPLADKPRVRSFYHKSHDGHSSARMRSSGKITLPSENSKH